MEGRKERWRERVLIVGRMEEGQNLFYVFM
jgi:hypothetical protein